MGLKSEIDSPSPKKVESEMCKRLQASQIARSRAKSGSTNASEGGKAVMKHQDTMDLVSMYYSDFRQSVKE